MAVPMTRGAFADSLNLAIESIITATWKEHAAFYSRFLNIKTTSRKEVQKSVVSGLGHLAVKTEGTGITYDSPVEGYNATWVPTHYGLGIEITEEMYEDDDHDQIRAAAKALPKSARATVEQVGHTVLNNGFAVTLGPDGVYLFSASHPLVKSGGTQSNLLTAADLSFASLSTAFTTLAGLKNEAGLPVSVEGAQLIVHPDNMLIAEQLMKSSLEPQSMDNSSNPIRGRLEIIADPWITDADSWFVLPKKADHNLEFYWRKKPRTSNGVDEKSTLNLWYNITARFCAGYLHYFPVLGNAGL